MKSLLDDADLDPSLLNARIGKGRRKLRAASFALLCTSVFIIIEYNLNLGPNKLPQQLIRIVLTIWLLASVYSGSKIAREISIVLFSIGAIGFLYLLVSTPKLHWLQKLSLLTNLLGYVYYLFLILASKDVNAFLDSKRRTAKRHLPDKLEF